MEQNINSDPWYNEESDVVNSKGEKPSRLICAIPLRVKAGKADSKGLTLKTSNLEIHCQWEDVKFLFLGIIQNLIDNGSKSPSKIRQLFRETFFGEEKGEKPKQYSIVKLLDIHIKGYESVFRIDSSCINYKSFFREVEYISAKNFYNLVKKIAYFSKKAFVNKTLLAYILKNKYKMKKYPSVYEFQFAQDKIVKDLSKAISAKELNFGKYTPDLNYEGD